MSDQPKKIPTMTEIQTLIEAGMILGPDVPPALVKQICSMLAEKAKVELAANWQYPPEPCAWRQGEDVQRVRLGMPEPTRTDNERWRYFLQSDNPPCFNWKPDGSVPNIHDQVKTHELKKVLIRERVAPYKFISYWAWSEDGTTPIFPIPIE